MDKPCISFVSFLKMQLLYISELDRSLFWTSSQFFSIATDGSYLSSVQLVPCSVPNLSAVPGNSQLMWITQCGGWHWLYRWVRDSDVRLNTLVSSAWV